MRSPSHWHTHFLSRTVWFIPEEAFSARIRPYRSRPKRIDVEAGQAITVVKPLAFRWRLEVRKWADVYCAWYAEDSIAVYVGTRLKTRGGGYYRQQT
jgi:hypothetical protein